VAQQTFGLVLLMLASVAGYVGVHHLVLGARGGKRGLHLTFAAVSLLIGTYAAVRSWRFGLSELSVVLTANKLLGTLELLSLLAIFAFATIYTGCFRWRHMAVASGGIGVFLGIHLARPEGLAYAQVFGLRQRPLPGGDTFWAVDRTLSPVLWMFHGVAALIFIWLFRCCWRHCQAGHRARALALAGALAVVLGSVAHSILADTQRSVLPSLLEFSYLALVLTMNLVLSHEVSATAALSSALTASESQLRAVLTSIRDAVVATDADGRVQVANPAAERLFGWRFDQVWGRRWEDCCRVESAAAGAADQPSFDEDATLAVVKRGAGPPRLVSTARAPLESADGRVTGSVYVYQDVTERLQLEQQLRHSQKMEALGQLAGGVAHDFNNLLTAVRGNAELLAARLRTRQDASAESMARAIMEASDKAAAVTRQLLSFARKAPLTRRRLDLNRAIGELLPMLDRVLDPRIRVEQRLETKVALTEADPDLIHSALLNLAVNARDAMPEGGTLTFATDHRIIDEREARPLALRRGTYVRVRVTDTGKGMAPDVLDRAFEPFFTTKPLGKGTGLGLSAVYGFARKCGGTARALSTPGQGTTIELYFPAVEPHGPPETTGGPAARPPTPAQGTPAAVPPDGGLPT
jgi:PAS domain S-box-containing protein